LTGVGCVSRVYTDHGIFELGGPTVTVRTTWGTSVERLSERLDVRLAILE
jgi:3-oxoadipate CoA-transferase beta subunit